MDGGAEEQIKMIRQRSSHPAGVAVSINQRARRAQPGRQNRWRAAALSSSPLLGFRFGGPGAHGHTSWRGDGRCRSTTDGWRRRRRRRTEGWLLVKAKLHPTLRLQFFLKYHLAMSTLLLRFLCWIDLWTNASLDCNQAQPLCSQEK